MKLLDRYIAGAVITGTLVAMLIVAGLDFFFSVIDQADQVGKGDYTLLKMLQYVVLTTPRSLYELFPLSALLGGLMGMGALAANSELIAMRASGIPVRRIIRSVLQAGVLMLVVAVFVGEVVAPAGEQMGQELRAAATSKRISFLGSHGLWVRDGNQFINARRVLANETLVDLTVYEFDAAKRLRVVTHAAQAHYQDGQWVLKDVRQSGFSKDHVEVQHLDRLARDSLLTPELLGIVVLKPEYMSIRDISQFVEYLDENGLDTRQYRYAFWGRIMTPLSALVMLFVSVPFVFGSLRSVSAGQRLFIGILVGFGFYLVSQISGQMGQVYHINPLLATLTPSVIFLLLGLRAVRRI